MGLAGRLTFFLIILCRLTFTSSVSGQDLALHTLPNGLQCAYWPDTTRLLGHVSLTLKGGPLLDPADADGLSNLYGHLLADRSDSLPGSGKIEDAVRQGGMVFRHATLAEGNFFCMSALPPDLEAAMGILATAIQNPGYDSSALVAARKTVAGEIQLMESRPEYYHEQGLRERLWGREQHRKNISGNYIQLAALNVRWIRDYLSAYLQPQQLLLAGTGRMDPEDFFNLADSLLGNWKSGVEGPEMALPSLPLLKSSVYFETENAFAAAPVLVMAWPVPGAMEGVNAQDLELFAAMANLKQGQTYRSLVGKGLARELRWQYLPSLAPGQMTLRLVAEPDSLVPCLEATRDALHAMGEPGYFKKSDLRGAERVLRLQHARRDDRSANRLAELGQAWVRNQLKSGPVARPAANEAAMEALARQFSPEVPHVAGLMHNLNLNLATGLESIFRSGPAIAAAHEQHPDTPKAEPDSIMSLMHLNTFRIYFEPASFQPDGPSLLALDTVAEMLQVYPDLRLYVNGFADGLGDGVSNYKLSIERARSVRKVLSGAHQLDRDRLVIRPYGEAFPEWPDDTPEHRALNRRVTFSVAPADAVDNVF